MKRQIHILLGVADAATKLGLTPARVRQLADQGSLPSFRTTSGVRIFRERDVERLIAKRAGGAQSFEGTQHRTS